jgi:aspartate-semialdehyde dehydrogenase
MKLAIVGATGMVGRTMLEVLNERNIDFDELHLVASASNRGKTLNFKGKEYSLITLEDAIKLDLDYVLFSAGGQISSEWAPIFAQHNTVVIDNSSAWRMDENCPLVVPQVNQNTVKENKIIANPNCSTIQMVLALSGLHKTYKIKRLVISTYQSVSGTGKDAVQQMEDERSKGVSSNMAYLYPIDQNCIPHCDVFLSNGYTKEEMKLVHETRKILNAPQIQITATAVRVPVVGGHSESINVEFENDFEMSDVRRILDETEGLVLIDNQEENQYPMPLFAKDKDDVMVGRLRRDESQPKALNMWVVADNLRKGAATNAVEILEGLLKK